MSLKVEGQYVYNVEDEKATYLLATGVLTAAPLFFTKLRPAMNEDAFGKLVLGQGMYTRDQLLAKLAARPVYVVRGKGDRLALLIGPTDAPDEIVPYKPRTTDQADPVAPWFTNFAKDSGSGSLNSVLEPRSAYSSDAGAGWAAHYKDFESRMTSALSQVGRSTENTVAISSSSWAAVRAEWQKCLYGRGLSMVVLNGYNGGSFLSVGVNFGPGRGTVPSGIGFFGGGYDGKGGYRGIANLRCHSNMAAAGVEGFGDLGVYKTNSDGGNHYMVCHRPTAEWPEFDRFLDRNAERLAAMNLDRPPRVTLQAPFPLVSSRAGYVVGLPHEHQWFLVEFSDLEKQLKVPGYGLYPSMVCAAVSGKVFKTLFPVSSISVESDRANAQSSLDQIPDDLEIRATWIPEGIKYGSVKPDESVVAVDMARAGDSVDAVEFTTVEDGSKTVTFGSMIGSADRAISKKKNAYAVFFAEGVVSDLAVGSVTFVKTEGSIVIRAGAGEALASHDAQLRIKMGASVTFTNCTRDEVAQTVFGFPTWTTMMEVGSSNKGLYSFDEVALTDGGCFATTTDDELARVVPLIIGYDREPHARPILAGVRGAGLPVRVL